MTVMARCKPQASGKQGWTDIVLPRTGKAPFVFKGALLVAARNTAEKGPCHLAIYESAAGFVAHIAVQPAGNDMPLHVVYDARDPRSLRAVVTQFDPIVAVTVVDVRAATHGSTAAALAAGQSQISQRIAVLRHAYGDVLSAIFGRAQTQNLSLPPSSQKDHQTHA
ncbi:MAG: hypothetical protein AAF337_00320 [Pseudomonadota bacterium]